MSAAPPAPPSPSGDQRRGRAWADLLGYGLLYAPLLFFGYGADDDAYRVLRAGRGLLAEGLGGYVSSRSPGYFVHEAATGVLDALGGAVLSNLGTLVMALLALGCFHWLLGRYAVPHPRLLVALVALHPFFWASAATTMDYVWSVALALAGWVALERERWGWGGVLLGLAVGARLSGSIVGVGVFGFLLLRRGPRARLALSAALAAGVAILCYLPPLMEVGWRIAPLLTPATGSEAYWTLPLRLGRFAYKNAYFWGLPAALLLVAVGGLALRERARLWTADRRALLGLCLFVIAGIELLYLTFPLEREYLLPALPFGVLVVGVVLEHRPRWLAVLLGTVVLFNAVSVNVARPDEPNRATGSEIGLWMEPGYLVEDLRTRWRVRGCETVACWTERMATTP